MPSNQLSLSLVRDTFFRPFNSVATPLEHFHAHDSHTGDSAQNQEISKSCGALWLQSGELEVNKKQLVIGDGNYVDRNDIVTSTGIGPTIILRFIVSSLPLGELPRQQEIDDQIPNSINTNDNKTPIEAARCEILFSEAINTSADELLLRLDQVDFPAAAVAHKHTHPGPGIRYLVDGGLTLSSEHGEQTIKTGDSWFEEANSPVKATAIESRPSRFVRAMLLPLEYEGRSTFTLHSQSDADKPMLQSNIRHFEKRIIHPNAH